MHAMTGEHSFTHQVYSDGVASEVSSRVLQLIFLGAPQEPAKQMDGDFQQFLAAVVYHGDPLALVDDGGLPVCIEPCRCLCRRVVRAFG